ncbi:MAG: hypothetical protein QNK03_21020 [Myxococcota bacterium]|nr:hypothetical protein [Myxococcota bacterium]
MNGEALAVVNLLLNLAATFYMVGLVWFVQRVHYPLFARVGAGDFAAYQDGHLARTGPVVGPAMLLEAGTAVALLAFPPAALAPLVAWLGLGLLLVIWLSTALLQVPRHRDLVTGFDADAHRRLVVTNWVRTVAWSLRGLLLLAAVLALMLEARA